LTVERQALALALIELLEVRQQDLADDAVDVDLRHPLDEHRARGVVLLLVDPGLALTQVARGELERLDLDARDILGVELGLDDLGDRVDEGRIGEQRGPVRATKIGDTRGDRQLLLGAHHPEARHLAEVHAEEVRRLVAGAARLDVLVLLGGPLDPVRRGAGPRLIRGRRARAGTGASKPGGRSSGNFAACHDRPRSFRWVA